MNEKITSSNACSDKTVTRETKRDGINSTECCSRKTTAATPVERMDEVLSGWLAGE
ncbi:hypothetical protein BaRGS_00003465, partial [Batillaria attramentaria]